MNRNTEITYSKALSSLSQLFESSFIIIFSEQHYVQCNIESMSYSLYNVKLLQTGNEMTSLYVIELCHMN